MANIVKLGSLLLGGSCIIPGSEYKPGKSIGFADGDSLSWVVVNGLLIANCLVLINISWDDLNNQGLVFGKQVTINGQDFLCRLLKVGTGKGKTNEWDAALDVVGDDDSLWDWYGAWFWGQESISKSRCALRGFNSARHYGWNKSARRISYFCFRPVLEPSPTDDLKSENRVCAIGGQSILYGKILELTSYDAIIQPEQTSIFAAADDGILYSNLNDGTIAIDQHLMAVQVLSNTKSE